MTQAVHGTLQENPTVVLIHGNKDIAFDSMIRNTCDHFHHKLSCSYNGVRDRSVETVQLQEILNVLVVETLAAETIWKSLISTTERGWHLEST